MRQRLRAYVQSIYPRSGQVSGEMVMKLRNISNAHTGEAVLPGKNVVLNKHAKKIGVSEGDTVEFEGDIGWYNGTATITNPNSFRKLSNY